MKKLLTFLVAALCSFGSMQADEVKLGRTLEFSSTPTEYTILSDDPTAVVTLSDGTGDSGTGKGMYYKSNVAVTLNAKCYRSQYGGAVISAYNENCYAGFKLEIADGYKLTVSQLYAKVAVSNNFSYRIVVSDGTNDIYTSQDKAISNYNKSSATNMEATVTPTSDVVLKGTVYVRLHYWLASSTSTTKYIAPLELSVTGDLVADKTVASTTTALTAVKVNGTAISDDNLASLVSTKSLTVSDKYVEAPTVTFTTTTTTTYTDETTATTTDDDDVVATKGDDAFTASKTIGDDTYTVSFGIDKAASLSVDVESFSLNSDKAGVAQQVVNVTGYNLTEAVTVTIPEVYGLTVWPRELTLEDGVAQTVTVSYESNDDVASTSAELSFTSGDKTINVPFTYSSTAAITMLDVYGGNLSWDFTTAGTADILSPNPEAMVCMANVDGFADGFYYNLLAAQGKYFYRKSNSCWQGRSLKFIAKNPGVVKVSFSNTGSGQNRSVKINGNVANAEGASGAGKNAATAEYAVGAGDVVITGYNVGDETDADVRIYSMTFTPSVCEVSVGDAGLATLCSSKALDFSTVADDVAAYVASSYNGNVVNMSQVLEVPAGTGVILKSVSGGAVTVNVLVADDRVPAPYSNLLVGVTEATAVAASTEGSYNYIFSSGSNGVGFYRLNTNHTLAAGKAYLHTTEDLVKADEAKGIVLSFDGETTAISNVKTGEASRGAYYTLSGVRVANPTKGLYIKDGKKVVVK